MNHKGTVYDPKSPLSYILQAATWSHSFKMSQITLYDGKPNPKAFIMSFEAAIQSIGGGEATMAKSLVMAVTGIARTWYTTLPAGRTFSWERLKEALFDFQGNYDDPVTSGYLYAVKEGPMETLWSFIKCFVHVKCQACSLSADSIIDAARGGVRVRPLCSKLS